MLKAYLQCIRLGNLDLDLKIRISDLQSNAKSKNGFWCICFWISFLPFHLEIWERIWKTVLKNSSLAQAHILSQKILLFTRIVLRILFWISQSKGKKEIHEIWIWISVKKSSLRTVLLEVKSVVGFCVWWQNLKSGFPNRMQLYIHKPSINVVPFFVFSVGYFVLYCLLSLSKK